MAFLPFNILPVQNIEKFKVHWTHVSFQDHCFRPVYPENPIRFNKLVK